MRDATVEREETGDEAPTAPPAVVYEERQVGFSAERDRYQRQRYQAANVSVVLFLAAAGLLIGGLATATGIIVVFGVVAGVAFLAAFMRQARFDLLHRRTEALTALNAEGLARLRRDWKALPLRGAPTPDANTSSAHTAASGADSGTALDLDLLGHASLQHLLNTTTTPAGQARLRGWLLAPASPAVVRERQAAVGELAPAILLREELALFGLLAGMTPGAYERFLAWAESEPWLARRPVLLWASRVLPVLTLLLLAASTFQVIRSPLWLVLVVANVLLSWTVGREVERRIDAVAERQSVFAPYAAIFQRVEDEVFRTRALRVIQSQLTEAPGAAAQMRRLDRLLRGGDLRRSILFPVIQALTLWTFHTLWLLEGWQRSSGPHARGWLEALGELEALAALATLAHDNPGWVFPEIVEVGESQPPLVEARDLGHPLLRPEACVGNDVTVGPPGTLLLVTGSNMSGKSTLLRAIGVNVALAQAGGPVCAAQMRLPPLALATSIRVTDSLEEGVSYFLAELRRLKTVVETAEATRAGDDAGGTQRTALFLLDEILHGTNTAERQIAVRRILRHLVGLGAIGAVSTHDLTLAQLPEIAAVSRPVYFTERFMRGPEGPAMTFDYTLRPGIAPSTNALKLMEIVGLPGEE